jgi:hypothetical protein
MTRIIVRNRDLSSTGALGRASIECGSLHEVVRRGHDRERRGPGGDQVVFRVPVEDRRKPSCHGPGGRGTMAGGRPWQFARGELLGSLA